MIFFRCESVHTHTDTQTHTHKFCSPLSSRLLQVFAFSSCRFGKGSFSFPRLVGAVTSRFSTEFELQEVAWPHAHQPAPPSRNRPISAAGILLLSLCPQLKRFHQEKRHVGFGSATLAMEQALEKTAANIKWLKENRGHVLTWLRQETA